MNRPAWRGDTTSLINLRNFNASTVARSALTDLLQEEILHEKETYKPPEVSIVWAGHAMPVRELRVNIAFGPGSH